MDEKVGIIVPVYNAEKYINRCVESLVGQTYQNIEIWLVNDCSQDGCGEICQKWSQKDCRIRYIMQEKNSGAGKARNTALDLIAKENTTAYIAFVDSDDYVDAEYIQYMYQLLKENDGQIAWIQAHHVPDTAERLEFSKKEKTTVKVEATRDYLMNEKMRIEYGLLWGKLYQADLWKQVRIGEDYCCNEDIATTYKVFYNAKQVVVSDRKLYYYCCSADSCTRRKNTEKRTMDILRSSLERAEYFTERKEPELVEMAYIAYLNDILAEMVKCKRDKDRKLYRKLKGIYKQNYKRGAKSQYVTAKQRKKYVLGRYFIGVIMLNDRIKRRKENVE